MSSIKKTSSIIIIAIIVAGIALGAIDQINSDDSDILEQIEFNAVYLENDSVVQISFHDKSNETESVVLEILGMDVTCLLYTSPSPRDATLSRMPSSA